MVFGVWIPLLFGINALSGAIGSAYETSMALPKSEARKVQQLLAATDNTKGGMTAQIVFQSTDGFKNPLLRDTIDATLQQVSTINGIDVMSPFDHPNQVSKDGSIAYAQLNVKSAPRAQFESIASRIRLITQYLPSETLSVEYGGELFATFKLPASEVLGVLAAIVILVFTFGSVLAMGLPIGTALVGLGISLSVVSLTSHFFTVPDAALSISAMIGLGVGIDYALFIVTRFREGIHDGLSVEDSVAEALDTSGRAVIFAGITVIISLLGLLIMGLSFVRGFAVASAVAVAVMIVASLTLLPAFLSMAGTRIDTTTRAAAISLITFVATALISVLTHSALYVAIGALIAVVVMLSRFVLPSMRAPLGHRVQKNREHMFWYRWSRFIQRRPWTSLLSATTVLVILGLPLTSMRLGFGDSGNAPEKETTRRAYDLISEGFGPGSNGPLFIAVTGSSATNTAQVSSFVETLRNTEGISFAGQVPVKSKDVALVLAYPTSSPQDESTTQLVHRLRDEVIPNSKMTALVGGFTAATVDFSDYLARRLPVLIAVVLILSFLLLMAVFRSLLVPLKAVLMNLLSIGAAYGVVVAVFQWGWAKDLIGVGKPGPVEAWAPMFLFAIVFGLSMDYEVFLLSRMKEEFDRTGDNATSVADGVAATARVITAAALIMVCVFAAFVLAPDRSLKMFGLGLAVAVLVDATIVRMLLVPATMELLGARNWWIPQWLDRLLPRIDVEGHHHESPVAKS